VGKGGGGGEKGLARGETVKKKWDAFLESYRGDRGRFVGKRRCHAKSQGPIHSLRKGEVRQKKKMSERRKVVSLTSPFGI